MDATSSRNQIDRKIGIESLKMIGAHVTTTEAVILNLLGDKNNTNFKEIQQIIKDINPLNTHASL